MNDKCFAMSARKNCVALNIRNCIGHVNCSFYKTWEQAEADRKKSNVLLRTLPAKRQVEIADKYYEGNMPWKECV